MDALETFEEITEQAGVCVNIATKKRNSKSHWGLPPNLERAKVAREKKQRQPKPAASKPPPKPAAITPARLGKSFSSYRTLIETCRSRADEMELSRLELDRLAGLPPGYSGKLLGKVENASGKNKKRIWPVGLEAMLGALGLKIVVIEDEAATALTLARRVRVDRAQQRFGNVSRITAAPALPAPKQCETPARKSPPAPATAA